jgi:hypothetical protein
MEDSDQDTHGQTERYREKAINVRALIPTIGTPEVREQLRLIALEYDRLAAGLEDVSESLGTPASLDPGDGHAHRDPFRRSERPP